MPQFMFRIILSFIRGKRVHLVDKAVTKSLLSKVVVRVCVCLLLVNLDSFGVVGSL